MNRWTTSLLAPLMAATATGCAAFGGPGFFSDRIGQTTGSCEAMVMTVESARGNLEISRGESEGAPINQNSVSWYCGELQEINLHSTPCPQGTNYVEISRNYVGPRFLATCYQS